MFLFYILSVFNTYESLPYEIRAKLEAEFVDYKKVEFSVVKFPKNYDRINLKADEDINVIGSTAYIPVNVIDKNGRSKRTTLSVRVKLFEDVFVAVKDLEKWQQLNTIDFQLVEKEVTSLRGETITSFGEILGKRADRFIKKGDILTKESIEIMPIVFPGDKLEASAVIGNVKVTFSAFSKQEGSIGDVIRIRSNENEIYKAEIIDFKNVLIVE